MIEVSTICIKDVETPLLSLPASHLRTLIGMLIEQPNWPKVCQLLLAYRNAVLGLKYKWTQWRNPNCLAANDNISSNDNNDSSALIKGNVLICVAIIKYYIIN